MIYLDNAATSWKKPETVYEESGRALRECSGNPGRSGHKISLAAGQIAADARLMCARLFGAADPSEISFSLNATSALNTAIFGTVRPGSHIITSPLEHNSVARPLEYLRSLGCSLTVLPASVDTGVDPEDVRNAVRPDTSLIVITHISNVTGTVNDIASVGSVAQEKGVPFLVDAAQSAGTRSIDVKRDHIDMLAFPGHKSLLGPQGTGGLYVKSGLPVRPLTRGGTGSFSELLTQPEQMPDRLESGTLNVPGLAGLSAGIRFILETGIDRIAEKEKALRDRLYEGLAEIPLVTVHAPHPGFDAGNVLSFTIRGMESLDVAAILDSAFDIAVRAGLHCAPYAHRMLGTIAGGGTVRVSPNYFNEIAEIDSFTDAVREIAG